MEVKSLGKTYVLKMGNFGVDLSFGQACELRRCLALVLKGVPYDSDPDAVCAKNVHIEFEDDDKIWLIVGRAHWRLDREQAAEMLEALDEALM